MNWYRSLGPIYYSSLYLIPHAIEFNRHKRRLHFILLWKKWWPGTVIYLNNMSRLSFNVPGPLDSIFPLQRLGLGLLFEYWQPLIFDLDFYDSSSTLLKHLSMTTLSGNFYTLYYTVPNLVIITTFWNVRTDLQKNFGYDTILSLSVILWAVFLTSTE